MQLRQLSVLLVLATAALGQQAITTRFGPVANGMTGRTASAAGDLDGDGVTDFAIGTPRSGTGLVHVYSGRTRGLLRTLTGRAGHGLGNYQPVAFGDADLDGVGDLAVPSDEMEVYSGATGARLWTVGLPLSYSERVCAVGDVNNDGRADLANIVYVNNNNYLWILSGQNGSQLAALATALSSSSVRGMHSLGDVDGNGLVDFVTLTDHTLTVYAHSPLRVMRTINDGTVQFEQLTAFDMNGDSRNEIVVGTNVDVRVYSAATGALLRSLPIRATDGICTVMGDLSGDGVPDIAGFYGNVDVARGIPYPRMLLHSGLDGRLLGVWSGSYGFPFRKPVLAGVGDVDGDAFGDLLIGDERAGDDFSTAPGGWQLVSGRLLATVQSIPVQCGGGPFFPQLGITRPVLGQPLTLVGRDCPPQAVGTVIMSLQPAHETNLGVSGCDAWFDFGTWMVFYLPPPGASWQVTVPLPNVPQLAGLGTALQALYGPTNSPLGTDLSNGIWARLGF